MKLSNINNTNKTNDTCKEKVCSKKIIYKNITQDDIDSISRDSHAALLNALYQCESYILLDENGEVVVNKKSFNYISSFYLSFIANKDSLSNEYLQARKALYKSFQQIKQERIEELQRSQKELEQELQGLDSKTRETKLKVLQREQERALREQERQQRELQRQARLFNIQNLANTYNTNNTKNLSANNNAFITKDSHLILESNDKSSVIIFLDTLESKKTNKSRFYSPYPYE